MFERLGGHVLDVVIGQIQFDQIGQPFERLVVNRFDPAVRQKYALQIYEMDF